MSMAMAGLLPGGGWSHQTVGAAPTTAASSPRHLRRHHRHHRTSILISQPLRFPGRRARRLFCEPCLEQDLAVEYSSAPAQASKEEAALRNLADLLDFRVGRVLNAWKHPEVDSLYVEEVDVGEPEPRIICSSLVKHIALDDLQREQTKMAWRANLSRNLKELRFLFCQTSPISANTREYVQKNYKDLKTLNPRFPILIRECSGVEPQLWARYDMGVERFVRLDGLSVEEINKKLEELVKAGGPSRV